MPIPLPVGAIIEMKIPQEVSFYSDPARTLLVVNSALGFEPLFTSPTAEIVSAANQLLKIKDLVPSSQYYINENDPFKFAILQLVNPASINPTAPFEITIYHESDIILTVDPNGLRYTATPGRLENLQIFPGNLKTRSAVPYEFSFETKNALFANGDIVIKVPNELEIDPNSLEFVPEATVSLTRTIRPVWNESTRTLTLP